MALADVAPERSGSVLVLSREGILEAVLIKGIVIVIRVPIIPTWDGVAQSNCR